MRKKLCLGASYLLIHVFSRIIGKNILKGLIIIICLGPQSSKDDSDVPFLQTNFVSLFRSKSLKFTASPHRVTPTWYKKSRVAAPPDKFFFSLATLWKRWKWHILMSIILSLILSSASVTHVCQDLTLYKSRVHSLASPSDFDMVH